MLCRMVISFLYDINVTWPFLYHDKNWPHRHAWSIILPSLIHHIEKSPYLIARHPFFSIAVTKLTITICRCTCQHTIPVVAYLTNTSTFCPSVSLHSSQLLHIIDWYIQYKFSKKRTIKSTAIFKKNRPIDCINGIFPFLYKGYFFLFILW